MNRRGFFGRVAGLAAGAVAAKALPEPSIEAPAALEFNRKAYPSTLALSESLLADNEAWFLSTRAIEFASTSGGEVYLSHGERVVTPRKRRRGGLLR